MQKVTILCVGKLKEKFYADAVSEYGKRLSRFCKLEITELSEERLPETKVPGSVLAGENGKLAPLQQGLQAGGVVGVGVGQKNGGQVLQRQPQLPEGGGDAAAGDAGVHQQAGIAAAHQSRVAGGTAGQSMYGGQTKYLAVCIVKRNGARWEERRLRSPFSSADATDTQIYESEPAQPMLAFRSSPSSGSSTERILAPRRRSFWMMSS